MGIQVNINSVTGQTPYYIFICNPDGKNCVYMDETSSLPFEFEIPSPFNTLSEYQLKLIDGNGKIITGNKQVEG